MIDAVATSRDRILSISAVTSVVSGRVYAAKFPQSPTFPAVLVERVDDVTSDHLRGPNSLVKTHIQTKAYAETRAAAQSLDQAILGDGISTGLWNFSGTVGSPSVQIRLVKHLGLADESWEAGTVNQWRVIREYMVHHR